MKKLVLITILIAFPIMFFCNKSYTSNKLSGIKSWLCFYSETLPDNTQKYDLYIFANEAFPPLEPLKKAGSKIVGYISLGEVETYNPYYEETMKEKLLFDENKNWPGSFRVNLANKKWHNIVIKKLIPKIIAKGFEGIFIDTIDTAIYLENEKGVKGAIDGAVKLIKNIRKKWMS